MLIRCICTFLTLQAPSHEMVKQTQTIIRLLGTICLSVFGNFVGLALKRLNISP